MSKITVIIATTLVLTGCSSIKLAYRHADRGIVWWVHNYIEMTDEQEKQLTQDIIDLRNWHCRTELPRYAQWLAELEQDVQSGNLQRDRVAYHQEQLLSFFPPLAAHVKPAAKHLLVSLSDEQVRELTANMDKRQAELEKKFLLQSPEQTRQARTERTKVRIERWSGALNEAQTNTLEEWSYKGDRQTEIWLEGRRNWQQKLLDALKHRTEVGFGRAIDSLIDNYEELRGPEYQQMMVESRALTTDLLTELLEEADQQQLDFLVTRISTLQGDFKALTCTGEYASGTN